MWLKEIYTIEYLIIKVCRCVADWVMSTGTQAMYEKFGPKNNLRESLKKWWCTLDWIRSVTLAVGHIESSYIISQKSSSSATNEFYFNI